MGMTMTQKILARSAGLDRVEPGQLIEGKLDLVLGNDITTPVAITEFEKAGLSSVFDRERIYELVWGIDGGGSSDTVMEHVRKIRAKLAAHTSRSCIETVWGCGYKWNG